MSFRRDAFVFYKYALRTVKKWKALDPNNTNLERSFLRQSIRTEMVAIRDLKTDQDRMDRLHKISNWFNTCVHYQIPYQKPYYFQSGVSMKHARNKFVVGFLGYRYTLKIKQNLISMKSIVLWSEQIKARDGNRICIYDLAFSPDGNILMVAAESKIYVYNINDGKLVQTLKGHKETVLCITFAHDGKRFASGSTDKQVIIWTSKMEGILKYSHNDAVRTVRYNPKSHQLLSCTTSDFGLWSPEQKTVTKSKVSSSINCCGWNEDGSLFALGLASGTVSIRFKSGDEKSRIDRNGSVWGCLFFTSNDKSELLAVVDWSRTLSFHDTTGTQVQNDRNINYDPLFINSFSNEQFLLIGGSNKKVLLHTLEGTLLDTVVTQNAWIWACKCHESTLAVGCQDGSIVVYEITLMTVHSLYKERYACRDSMTDVVIRHLLTGEKVRIKCRDLIKKIAIYEKTLAIQLPERVILYELRDSATSIDMNYKVKEKINVKIECSLLVLCSANLILCQEKRLQSLSFSGQLEREWMFPSQIRYIKTIGGVPRQEGLILGLKSGQIETVFLHNIFHIEILKLPHAIRCLDLNTKHQKIAVIDERNKCLVYELGSKQQLFEESNITSIAWNSNSSDLLCLAGPGFIGIKTDQLPLQIVNNEFSNKTFVVGFSGCQIFTLLSDTIIVQKISYSKFLFQFMDKNMIDAAYRMACLNVTYEDWQALANMALSKSNLDIARKCLIRLSDWHYLNMINAHYQSYGLVASSEQNQQIFLAKFYSYRGLFSEAAKLYKRLKNEYLAIEMFTDLQMHEQANDYRAQSNLTQGKTVDVKSETTVDMKPWQSANNFGDLETMSQLYVSNGEYEKAFQIISNVNTDTVLSFIAKLDKGETKLLSLIANFFISKEDFYNAIEVYKKMGDLKGLANVFIKAKQWDEAFQIAKDFPQLKQDIYLPYALWLAENERFIEAQKAFYEAGQMGKSYNVLNQLLINSINENRFNDAAYYSWLLANHFNQLSATADSNNDHGDDANNNSFVGGSSLRHREQARRLHKQADIYYAYYPVYKYIEEPFTSIFVDILFNSALFLFHFLDDDFPPGISKVNILFALTKLGKNLGHYKLVRIAYKRLLTLRLPSQFDELVESGSIEIQTKPFVDAEDLASFCFRCSATNSLFSSRQNKCVNCQQKFNQSFYSFDTLPLIEFEIDDRLTHDQIRSLLEEKDTAVSSKNSIVVSSTPRGSTQNWMETIAQKTQMLEVFTADTLPQVDNESSSERFNISDLIEHVNPRTNLIILDENKLSKLDLSNLLVIEDRFSGQQSFFLNMMPEIGITACSHCNKFFYSDEYEFQILKNGKCPFCRN